MGLVLVAVRYVLPAAIVIAGFAMMAFGPESARWEGGATMVGAGLSVALLNWLHRQGVTGDVDRRAEDDARRYLDEHGHWPDERSSSSGA